MGEERHVERRLLDALRRAILTNFWLKLASFGLALALWFVVSSEHAQRDVTLYNVPVRVWTARSDIVVTGVAYRVVDVRVRGPANRIARLKPEDVVVWVDASSLASGQHLLTLDASFVRRPEGIEVLRIDPPTLPIELQRVITHHVPIRPRFQEHSLAANYVVLGYEVQPERAQVTGPERVVSRLEALSTRPISLAGVNSSLTVTAPLDLTGLESARVMPQEATITIHVEEVVERRFPKRSIVIGARGVEVIPPVVDVIVRGPRSMLQALREQEIRVTLSEAAPLPKRGEDREVALVVQLPAGLRATEARCEPERVRLRSLR
ncbi:MAG: CdaR family protein [Blastocatellia bacterium]|nr:CdaR family protein [Blastocatellia bacterium]MCS7158190.1 CdaR family protein [Blastocatellia bacterium]MCX7752948.1 CdaR family protein [Blastocatellia bacterium]MDW8168471.1 CdaR family protein [Acidobacteriota bacterium]MDW8256885.1 CdaR family protein [Acidobacteriota bacterium]